MSSFIFQMEAMENIQTIQTVNTVIYNYFFLNSHMNIKQPVSDLNTNFTLCKLIKKNPN